MNNNWFYKYLMLLYVALASSESYYSIIAPGLMKSNRKYTVAVTLHDADEPCSIRVSIEGPSYNKAEEVYVRPLESKQIEFLPPKLMGHDYRLIAEGVSGFMFKNESKLFVDGQNGPKIYIQTDKAIYRPQDLVQFRVVILDEHTRPLYLKEPVRIEILDSLYNRVKQFKDIALIKGVYTGKFQLSEQPVTGAWNIKVIISGKYAYSNFKTISVRKYVLPKFSVFVKAPKDVVLGDGYIKAVVYGKYTFDKYVEGIATVELWNRSVLLQQKKLDVDSLFFVEFQLENLKDYEKIYGLLLKVMLTEKHTGITEKEQHFIVLRKERYYITIPDEEIEFKNNKPYRLRAHVKYWSGAAVLDYTTPIVMDHGNTRYESYLDTNGVATFEFEHEPNAGHTIMYKDANKSLPNIYTNDYLMFNNTEYYCKLTLLDNKLRLGKMVEIEVSSIGNIPYLVYTIVGHGSIIRLEHITLPPNQKSYTIEITPSIEMVPRSHIYVHYVHNGNLRYEEMTLNFPYEFENQISVSAPQQVNPGQEITIELKAQPKSYVSILAVDLSVCLLDCSYDIDKGRIFRELRADTTYTPIAASVYPGLTSGVITLTNAHYPFVSLNSPHYPEPSPNGPARFRNKFPETWIFQNLEIKDTTTQLVLDIPDTITTWRITAFSNNDITGFGIVDGPTDITTIQPFFISLNLPYSIKRGEIVAISATIFNYLNQSLDTEVIMYNNDEEFYFMESTVHGPQQAEDEQQQINHINVPSDSGKTVSFLINPKQVGEISLRVSATNSLYSDAVHQKLKVEPEGVAKHHNQATYLSGAAGETLSSSFAIDIPVESVPDSQYITLSVGGDYIIPSLENLNDLVQMPTGCGEQNIVNFAPNILILEYLKANGKFSKEKQLVETIISYMDIGYQQQLSFRHQNGGYSVFGENSDKEASTWLTAYVVRFFIKAAKYSSIEERIIETGLDYLAKQQGVTGEFPNNGYLLHLAHKNKYGFTAFVLLTFLEDHKYAMIYNNTIKNGLKFLNLNLEDIHDIYALSIIATTLKLAKDANAKIVIDKLKSQSNADNKGLMWWSANDKNRGTDVEITAYALMALIDTPGDHLPILKWLLEQRNAQGGFKSTHDTVVGLQALVKFYEKFSKPNHANLKITYSAKDEDGNEVKNDEFRVHSVLILQKHELPKSSRYVSFVLSGVGHSLLQLSYQYNMISEQKFQDFLIKPKANLPNADAMDLEICFTYQSTVDSTNDVTNMVIMEANLPSGYRSDAESSPDLIDNELIQRIESKNSESTIILYFDNLSANVNHCLNIAADKTSDDSLDNRVKQFKDIALVKGVYTGKFQLSEQPVMGTWTIKVIISGKYAYSNFKTISVRKYVLPKFSVFVKAPKDVVLGDGYIRAVIYGKYTFDKYVEGNATVELWGSALLQQKKLDVESLGFVEFQLENPKDYENLDDVELKVMLTEKHTGITQSEEHSIDLSKQRYYITIPDEEIEFKNNKPYRLAAHVKYWTGAAVLDYETPIIMEHGKTRYESYLDTNGVATFEFEHDPNAGHTIIYKDVNTTLPNIYTNDYLMFNNNEYYCKLTLRGNKLRLGKMVQIEVSSIGNIPYLVYTIVGHGSIIRLEHIKLPPNQNSYTIQITPSIEMIPRSHIYVHYVHNGNLRYEEMTLSFPDEFENQISVSAPQQVKPGQEVTIELKAQPKSYVSVLAVDLSVCLLDCSYDLDKDLIISQLYTDTTYTPIAASVYPGLTSGVITLTNAHYPFVSLDSQYSAHPASNSHLRFRNKFPETWIFQNLEIKDATTQLILNIPDTITTWRITAFSNNDITGFGIVDGPTDITTIQPFFISLNLPYSIKRGEIVAISATIFNYLNQSLDTEVIMYNNDEEFYFMESTVHGPQQAQDEQQQTKHINVPSDSGKTVSFLINPKQVGEISLRVSATNSLYSDAVHQRLKVEPEGVAKHHNQATYLSGAAGETLSSSFAMEIPDDSVPGSQYITLSVGGDYLVPSLENLNDLVQMPTGCGEQNIVNFAPNILILEYLKANGQFSKEKQLVETIMSYMDIGYQQQLSFRHKNGGYSVFGENSDKEASTWLTAYVVRFFIKAAQYSSIEERIIETGLEYLAKQQGVTGEFPNTGYLLHLAHQNKYGLTAFVLLTFLEDHKYAMKFKNTIQNGLQFLNSNLDNIDDTYALSIIATTLKLAKHPNAKKVINKLKSQSNQDHKGLMWWSANDKNRGTDVEITAYALMALIDTPGDHLPILKWLLEQRNAQGGFKSTHDTVVGLQALVKFYEKFSKPNHANLKITYSAKDVDGNEVKSDEFRVHSVLILQKQELPKSARNVTFVLSGVGHSLLQLSYQYNMISEQKFQDFLIQPKANLPNSEEMNLEICFTYQSTIDSANDVTNMVIMEANLPSGYRSDAESSPDLIDNELIQRIESKNSESTIILYFDNLSANVNHCLNIAAYKTSDVMMHKPAAIIMYDYYNLSRSNTEFYKIPM